MSPRSERVAHRPHTGSIPGLVPEGAPPIRRPVAVVVSRFPKVTETFILREIRELERQGQPVRLVPLLRHEDPVVHPDAEPWVERALFTPFLSAPILRENLQAFLEAPLRYLGFLGRIVAGSLRSANLLKGTLAIFPKGVYIGRVLAREGVGHLHAHFATHPAMAAWIASEFGGLPWSFTAHAHDIFLRKSRALLEEKIRRAAFVRVISDYNRRFLEKRYPDAAQGRMRVVHMGIDPDRYGPGNPKPGRIVCVASLRPYKGIPALVEACGRSPLRDRDFELLLVGDGPQRRKLEDRIDDLGMGDRVRLLGPRTEDEVAELLASASIFVHPSTVTRRGWMDGIPVALMEAMATQLPVVSTWVSGIPELVGDREEGLLVFPDDPGALAEALASLLDDPEGARAMGRRGRGKVEEDFHLERCATELMELIRLHTPAWPPELMEVLGPGLGVVSEEEVRCGTSVPGILRLRLGRDAVVAEVTRPDPGMGNGLVVKVHRELEGAERTAEERARIEFQCLRALHGDGMRDGKMDGADGEPEEGVGPTREGEPTEVAGPEAGTVPRPVALLSSSGTVVMERARGRPLDELIRGWRSPYVRDENAQVPSALRAAGRWLRRLQDQTEETEGQEGRECLDRLLVHADHHLFRLRGRLGSRVESLARARIDRVRTRSGKQPPRAVGHHCDFWPGNVLVDGVRITVLDFEGYRRGLPYEDVAHFLVHLELALGRPWLRTKRRRARRTFLDGYGLADDLDPELLALCISEKSLDLLAREPKGGGGGKLSNWWRRRILTSLLERGGEE
jgi:colanic acid/amylovoran biosynthesis glycosyltransferase